MLIIEIFSALGSLIWVSILLLPYRPWSTDESLDVQKSDPLLNDQSIDLSDVTVLTPARDEADVIAQTARGILQQGPEIRWVLVDDQSTDGTARIAELAFQEMNDRLRIIQSSNLPEGWAGKLWALEQGRKEVKTPYTLLLDADIELMPGIVKALKKKMLDTKVDMVSLMAELRMKTFFEKLLIPSFVYFFKLMYPFALGNSHKSKLGVAAGGCILIRTKTIEEIGGFAALRDALIDDCTLAQKVKNLRRSIWMGLTRSVLSHRGYDDLSGIWNMVARSAFTQLRYSIVLLLVCTSLMVAMFAGPILGIFIFQSGTWLKAISFVGLFAMIFSYRPILKFYSRSPMWSLGLPAIGGLYLAMTWTSAIRYWRGHRSRWKGRIYLKSLRSETTQKE